MQQFEHNHKSQSCHKFGKYVSISPKQQNILNYLYSFDLYIDSITLHNQGYFYFVWKKGGKSVQSLKYNSISKKKTTIKETLCLNLAMHIHNHQPIQKNTSLQILDSQGRQIEQVTLSVHRWSDQFTNVSIALKNSGCIQAKVRAKMLLKIDDKIILSDNDNYEDLIDEWRVQKNMQSMKSKYKMRPNYEFIDDQKDELTKLRKQLQDTLYYNSKLKNDRNVLISQTLSYEGQLAALKQSVKQQFQQIMKHFNRKIQIRENIYQEQIDKLVMHYNLNSQNTDTIIRNLVIELNQITNTKNIMELQMKHQMEISKQYQCNLNQLQQQKQKIRKAVIEMNSKHQNLFIQNVNLNKLYTDTKQQLQNALLNKDQLNKHILELSLDLQTQKQTKIKLQQNLMQMNSAIVNLQASNKQYIDMVQKLSEQLESNRNQLQFTENAYRKQKQQNQLKEDSYRNHIRKLQQIIYNFEKQSQQAHRTHQKDQVNKMIKANNQKQLDQKSQIQEEQKKHTIWQNERQNKKYNEQKNLQSQKIQNSMKVREGLSIQDSQYQNYDRDNLFIQIKLLKEEIDRLIQQNNLLKQKYQTNDKNILSIEQHDQLKKKLKELQSQLAQTHKSGLNSEFSGSQFSLGPNRKKKMAEITYDQYEEMLKRLQNLQIQRNQLQKQKQDYKEKYDLLTVEMAKKYAEAQRQKQIFEQKIKQIKIIQYCDSEDQQNKKMAEKALQEYQKIMKTKMDQLIEDEVPSSKKQQRSPKRATSKQEQPQSAPLPIFSQNKQSKSPTQSKRLTRKSIRKASSMDQPLQNTSQIKSFEQLQQNVIQQESAQSKLIEYDSSSKQKQITQHNNCFSTQEDKNHKKSRNQKNNQMSKSSLKFDKSQIGKQSIKVPNLLFGDMFPTQNQKDSAEKVQIRQNPDDIDIKAINKNSDPASEKDKNSPPYSQGDRSKSAQKSFKSRDSFISKDTIYMFQKVSHRQKIDRLTADVQNFKKIKEQCEKQIEQLQKKLKQNDLKLVEVQQKLKDDNEQIKILKQSLLLEVEKHKQIQKINKHTQTQIQRENKHVQVYIVDPQLISVKDMQQKTRKQMIQKQKQFIKKSEQTDAYIKLLLNKINDKDANNEILLKKYEVLQTQFIKLNKIFQDNERAYKQNLQTNKLQKNQLQYQVNNLRTEDKKLKGRIQQLEEKLKKNDVLDLLKQTQFQAENANKKIIQLNRNIYQIKLEKETIEDESKLLRKKNSDLQKKISQLEDQIDRLDKDIEDIRRRDSKNKRQLQDREDTITKLKDQVKRLNQEMGSTKTYYMQQEFERKKLLDQLQSLQNNNDQKQYEINNLKKQLERSRKKIQEKQDQKIDKKSQLKRQIEKLEVSLNNKDRQIMELQTVVKQLTHKIQYQNTQNKKNLQEKTAHFSEKLKIYINDITELKKSHEESIYQIDLLRSQLSQTLDQLNRAKSDLAITQQKYNEALGVNSDLKCILTKEKNEHQKVKEDSRQVQIELQSIKSSIKMMKEDLDRQKKGNIIKKDQIQKLKYQNEQLTNFLNKYKIKLSDYETDHAINKKYNQKISIQEQQVQAYKKQLRQLKLSFEQYRVKYNHTPHEIDSAVRKAQVKIRNQFQHQLAMLKQEYQKQIDGDRKKLQGEIVNSINQVNKIRKQSQQKSDIIAELQLKLSKLEVVSLKLEEIQKLYDDKQKQLTQLRPISGQCQKLIDKISRLQQQSSQSYSDKSDLMQALTQSKAKTKQLQAYIDQFQSYIRTIENQNKDLLSNIKIIQSREKQLASQVEQIKLANKVLQQKKIQLQKNMGQMKTEHLKKVSSLEQKMEMMSNVINQHGKVLQNSYEGYLNQYKAQIQQAHLQIYDKKNTIKQLENVIDQLHIMNGQAKRESEKLKQKIRENEQYFQIEIAKFKNKLNESQKMHKAAIRQLQNQLQDTASELTALKMKNISMKQLRSSGSQNNLHSSQAMTQMMTIERLEDKLKGKANKIEQLEQNIFILEQTIIKIKKNSNQNQNLNEKIATLQHQKGQLEKKLKQMDQQYQKSQKMLQNTIISLKNHLNQIKRQSQQKSFELQQKDLTLQSTEYELKTLKSLYEELQSQLERRKQKKTMGNQQIQQINQQLLKTKHKLSQIQIKYEDIKQLVHQRQNQIDRRSHTISILQTKIIQIEKSQNMLRNTLQNKISQQGQHYKVQINRLTQQYEALAHENKILKQEKQKLEKQNWDFSTQLSMTQNSIDSLSNNLQQMANRNRQLQFEIKQYQSYQQKCYRNFKISLQQAFSHNYLLNQIQQKEFELNSLVEEVDQLKFLHQRKLMDFEELKKQNYELKIKAEDADFATEQVEQLRQICDKLEQQKKQTVFKLQFLMMQFQSIMNSSNPEIRYRLQQIIRKSKAPL